MQRYIFLAANEIVQVFSNNKARTNIFVLCCKSRRYDQRVIQCKYFATRECQNRVENFKRPTKTDTITLFRVTIMRDVQKMKT